MCSCRIELDIETGDVSPQVFFEVLEKRESQADRHSDRKFSERFEVL